MNSIARDLCQFESDSFILFAGMLGSKKRKIGQDLADRQDYLAEEALRLSELCESQILLASLKIRPYNRHKMHKTYPCFQHT